MIDPAIYQRRSIRKFQQAPLPKEAVEQILDAAIQAPSAKNRQPWRFVVVQDGAKQGMLEAMRQGIRREASGEALLKDSARFLKGAEYTLQIMEQAPVTIFILYPEGGSVLENISGEERLYQNADLQSIGAAIQNMALAATGLGLGSLWNCDVYFAYQEILRWLETEEQLVAAMSFGYPAQSPLARPRKKREAVTWWL